MRRRKAAVESLSHEFELDLAPLLAVMVKLVPVLISSSAFIPIVVIQSQLPAPVLEATQNPATDETPHIELKVNPQIGFQLKMTKGSNLVENIDLPYPTNWNDLGALKTALAKIKTQAPSVFRLDLVPQGDISYDSLIKIIDTARKIPSGHPKIQFKNPQSGTDEETDYMFPDVVFANVLEV